MIISQGNVETLEEVADLWMEMVRETQPSRNPDKETWKTLIAALLTTGKYVQLLAIKDNKIIGFGDFMLILEPSTGKLQSQGQHFFVLPQYRNGSAGYKMYRAWKKISKGFGATAMELLAFSDKTERWTKVGFVPSQVLLRKEI